MRNKKFLHACQSAVSYDSHPCMSPDEDDVQEAYFGEGYCRNVRKTVLSAPSTDLLQRVDVGSQLIGFKMEVYVDAPSSHN